MAKNNKYVELIWSKKYDSVEKGEKTPIEGHNLPFQVTRKRLLDIITQRI